MKIKAVSELTGLTTRAIRVYIDEELFSPKYTENYLGRRSFDFSKDDVDALQSIATLRKYGFSIDEIRSILLDSQNSIAIIESIKRRTQETLDEYHERLNALSRVEDNKAYSISELSEILSQAGSDLELPIDLPKKRLLKTVLTLIKRAAVFCIVWAPFVLASVGLVLGLTSYTYPAINIKAIFFTLLTLIPSISLLVISKFKAKRILKLIILCLCVVAIPFSFIFSLGIVSHSETTDFRYYRKLDPDCLANRRTLFHELFPAWPHYFDHVQNEDGDWVAVYLDAKYYYHYYHFMDYTYDVYAEWPLDEDDFAEEVERVRKLFKKYDYVEIKKGNYTCLIRYSGDEPFEKATDNYTYAIFAYDEENKKVRYIYCDSLENGVDQPYYLQLDW